MQREKASRVIHVYAEVFVMFSGPSNTQKSSLSFSPSRTRHRSLLVLSPVLVDSRRPISRVKARTSRQGLPVDDEDDVDEELNMMVPAQPAVVVAVGPAEATRSGSGAPDPWKSKGVTRPRPAGENDVDGVQQLESYPAKVRKGKAERERLKVPSPVDREPRTKVERTSNQDCGVETPSFSSNCSSFEKHGIKAGCILPFLRQLHATTLNGDPCSRRCSPAYERDVWTCGQNSYGELGHSDTGTRKVHCLVEAFKGKEVVDIAAGMSSISHLFP